MSSLRRILACLCLVLTASMPCWAEGETVPPVTEGSAKTMALLRFTPSEPGITATTMPLLRFTPPEPGTTFALNAATPQTTGTTSSHGKMSHKKKTWIIVGSVLGAVAIGAALSHSGGGSGGGGY